MECLDLLGYVQDPAPISAATFARCASIEDVASGHLVHRPAFHFARSICQKNIARTRWRPRQRSLFTGSLYDGPVIIAGISGLAKERDPALRVIVKLGR